MSTQQLLSNIQEYIHIFSIHPHPSKSLFISFFNSLKAIIIYVDSHKFSLNNSILTSLKQDALNNMNNILDHSQQFSDQIFIDTADYLNLLYTSIDTLTQSLS